MSASRWYGSLPGPEITARMTSESVLCLPIGSYEQHGPHLPLHTDSVIAENFTARLTGRYGDTHDLWGLPAIPFGLSLQHAWSPGTISLRAGVLAALLDTITGEFMRVTPARRLLIINGHGGNRGILEALAYELQASYPVRVCVIHPNSLAPDRAESALPEIHAGTRETSIMLALAPGEVHQERLPEGFAVNDAHREQVRRLVLEPGTTWPWSSGDSAIATLGVMGGDPRLASAGAGESIIASALNACETVLQQLRNPS